MSKKHTPGPWNKIQRTDHTAASIRTESGISVATAFSSEFDQTKANASLIAAAPELLEALARLEFAAQCRDNTMGDPSRLIQVKAELASAARQARDAIAKATGE